MEEEKIIEEIVKKKEKKKKRSIKEIFKGFTLVELLAVIVILAIIMIIAIPSVLSTMDSAKRSTFGEYVTKVYNLANDKYLSDEMLLGSPEYVRYDITKDLGLSATGSFKGYAVIVKRDGKTEVYIGMTDGEYYTATQLGDDESTIVPYINYTLAGEPKYTNELTKYDGKTNYFVRGTYNSKTVEDVQNEEYNLPEASNSSSLTPIEEVLSPEAAFLKTYKDFYTKAIEIQNSGDAHTNTNVSDDGWTKSTIKQTVVNYNELYPSKTNVKGFVILLNIHNDFYGETNPNYLNKMTFVYQFVVLKDENYHTVVRITSPSQGVTVLFPMTIGALYDNYKYYQPQLITSLKDSNVEEVQSQITGDVRLTGYDYVIPLIDNFLSNNTFFISNSYNDGLTDYDFTEDALVNKYEPIIAQMMF